MTLKRGFCDMEHSDAGMLAVQAAADRNIWQPSRKRGCGAERANALSCSSLLDLQASQFLQQLAHSSAAGEGGCANDMMQCSGGLNGMVWRCMAELNLLMQARFNSVQAADLKSYHSFTRSDKNQLVQRFAAACGVDTSATSQPASALPLHVALAEFVLGRAWNAYGEAALTKVKFELPGWLGAWAAKWQYSGRELTVIVLQAYDGCSDQPARRLFVPFF